MFVIANEEFDFMYIRAWKLSLDRRHVIITS